MKLLPIVRLAAATGFALACGAGHAADCDASLRQHLATDLSLSFDAFDQADATGWRPLEAAGCDAEAATLIAAYAAQQANPHPVLAWHRAQELANAGATPDAIAAARATLRLADVDPGSGFAWNAYANATIAFLQGDAAALKAQVDALAAAAAAAPINRPNLKSAQRLQRCFGQAYKAAYSCPPAP
jgi:hypothetical protein